MDRQPLLLTTFGSIFLFFQLAQSATIIFDMDGVLTQSNRLSFLWMVGPWHLLGFYNPFTAEETFIKFLDSLEPRKSDTPLAFYHAHKIPQIMCDWMCGRTSTKEIRTRIETQLRGNPQFSNHASFIKSISSVLFTPELFVKGISPLKEGVKLFKRCAQIKDQYGNRKHKMYILSNWDPDSFPLLNDIPALRAIFDLCDGIVISGAINLMKPDIRIFDYFLIKYNIDPHNELTVFIDNDRLNIAAARELNKQQLHAFLCEDGEFKSIKKSLKKLGII